MSSQQAFRDVLSRLEKRDKASKGQGPTAEDIYKTGAYAGMMVPSAGIADYFGQYPNPEKAGEFLPSFDENVDKGEYFNAAMQFLGATGDTAYTVPMLGTLTGTALKALALGGKLSKAQLSSLMDGIGRFFTDSSMGPKLVAEGVDTSKVAMSDQGDLFSGSSPSAKTTKDNSTDLQDELFINMGDDGALLEYEDIGFNLNEYMIRNDRTSLLKAFNSPNYEAYADVMQANLKKAFPSGRIRVQRVENYADPEQGAGAIIPPKDKQIISYKDVNIEDVKFVGGGEEKELILLDTPRENRKGAMVGDKQLLSYSISKNQPDNILNKSDLNLGSGSLFSAESKKGRKLLIVSCSDTKCPDDGDMKAMDRYLGPIFQTLKAQGVPPNVDVAIMSAKHGLIKADTPLKNYNLKMTKDLASKFKGDPDQMNRIKNTMAGYDDVIVQGGKDYKDVVRTAAGDMNIKEIPGGRGIGDQRELMMDAIAPFRKIKNTVYHFTQNAGEFTKFDIDKGQDPFSRLGVHVGSKPKSAQDRFVALNYAGPVNTYYRQGMPLNKAIEKVKKEFGTDPDFSSVLSTLPTKPKKPGSIPLKANLSKPFLNPETKKPFTEGELFRFIEDKGMKFSKEGDRNIKGAVELRKELAEKGFTHVPYVNDYEDVKELSYIMLVDRPKGKPKVLQGTFAKKDPAAADDPDFMKAEGGVVEMKDKAVNMYRGTQGIEPFIQYLENGGEVQSERNIFEEQRMVEQNSPFLKEKVEPVQTKKEALIDLADREMGLELINRVGFDPLAYKMMQAGLRDNRNLSDFLKIYPTATDDMTEKQKDDALTKQLRGLGLSSGKYFPLDNMVVVEPMTKASAYFQSPTDMIIMHEILHKGAETLTKDPNVDLKSLREKLDAGDYKNIGDDTEEGRAEHRYIQAVVNKAYIDKMLTQTSVYGNRGLVQAQKILDDPKSDVGAKIMAKSDLKNIPKYIDRDKKEALIKEIRRSTNMYMEEDGKVKFKKMVEDLYPNKDLFNRDKEDVEDNFTVKELRQVYDLLNITMLNHPATKKFTEEMSKAAPSGQLMDKYSYSDLFPEQFADPNRPYKEGKKYRGRNYFEVLNERDKRLREWRKKKMSNKENKAKGGVVEMKERAINMNRGPQGIEPFIKYMQNGGNVEIERMNQELRQIEGNPELEGIIQRIREEPIMDGTTIRYRTEEEMERIIQQMLRQPNIDITPEGGIKIMPSVEITGGTPSSETFMGTMGGEKLFLEDKDLSTRARLGVDVELPKGDRAGIGAGASYFKGTREFPKQLAQYGFPDKVRRGSGKVNYGDIDAYYSMQGGPTISGSYNPVTEQYGGQINYGMPLRDMGIPQLSEKAVNMFRRLVR